MGDLKHSIVRLLKQMRSFYKICQIVALICFPVVESIIVNYLTNSEGTTRDQFVVLLIAVGLMHIVIGFGLVIIDPPAPALLMSHEEHKEKATELEALNKELVRLFDSSSYALDATFWSIGVLSYAQTEKKLNFGKIMDDMMAPWVRSRCEIWNYEPRGIWNYILYWVEGGTPDGPHMKVVWRQCDERIERLDRTWVKGDGHIGRCWLHGKTQISPINFCQSPLRQIQDPRPEDNQYYSSVIATPVTIDGVVMGVLAFTSSSDAQFSEDEHGQTAGILGMLVARCASICRTDRNLFAPAASTSNNKRRQPSQPAQKAN